MAGLVCKPTVRFKAFTPALLRILRGVFTVAQACTDVPDVVITSANDSTHSPKSRHYTNEAVDLRSRSFPSSTAKQRFAALLRAELGPAFTVLYEGAGTPQEHWHIQPKKGTDYVGPV
ncbi:MAG TPA: hypothetical protein VEA16_13995 [Vicinamibacterales bacterium]|nr:hypothetical protein [Vicinamibacterales bacterium]